MKPYGKLVRDRIPELIRQGGGTPVTETMDDDLYLAELDRKLNEEVAEYQESKALEELADILEVVEAIAVAQGATLEQLAQVKAEKKRERGGFAEKIYLIRKEG